MRRSQYALFPRPFTEIVKHLRQSQNVFKANEIGKLNYNHLLRAVGDARVVLIGEASHGTHEFYKERAELTKQLIMQKKFSCVAAEADWPDAYRVNRYVRGLDEGLPIESLEDFQRFPLWMWRNDVVLEFVEWLRGYNDRQREEDKVGFYGLDLYSLTESIEEVLAYLSKEDPDLAKIARERYACFDKFQFNSSKYAYEVGVKLKNSCEQAVSKQLLDMLQKRSTNSMKNIWAKDQEFYARMNAKVVRDAEQYYRLMYVENTWNYRDSHMLDTLLDILDHLQQLFNHKDKKKAIVWAHNSHIGDASG